MTIFAIAIATFIIFGIALKVLNKFAKDGGDNVLSAIHITVITLAVIYIVSVIA